jgi:hypothetical protein
MPEPISSIVASRRRIARCFSSSAAAALVVAAAVACAPAPSPEARTARHFESLRQQPDALRAFLRDMPKGGDLHNHLAGAIYAETLIAWAAESGLCVNRTTAALAKPPCNAASGQVPAATALTDTKLYGAMIDGWSMRNWSASDGSGRDHFFATFEKFLPATSGRLGAMLAEAVTRAAEGHVSYLELMITPDDGLAARIAQQSRWSDDFAAARSALEAHGIDQAVRKVREAIRAAEIERDRLLKCGMPEASAGCTVTVRYLYQALRALPPPALFAQLVTGFTLANDAGSGVVGVNLVQPEDDPSTIQNFAVQMRMLQFLRPLYPNAHLSLHAGELRPQAPPGGAPLTHVRDAMAIAGAERIGHGVDVLGEPDAPQLLAEMARRRVLVEICLTSNDLILGVRGPAHPLADYIKAGVPVALATDDEGVSRSDLPREFFKAAVDQRLGYLELKAMARASLQYAFVDAGAKARLQSELERAFAAFEARQ